MTSLPAMLTPVPSPRTSWFTVTLCYALAVKEKIRDLPELRTSFAQQIESSVETGVVVPCPSPSMPVPFEGPLCIWYEVSAAQRRSKLLDGQEYRILEVSISGDEPLSLQTKDQLHRLAENVADQVLEAWPLMGGELQFFDHRFSVHEPELPAHYG